MSKKREELLGKDQTEFDLNEIEKSELAALMELVSQAQRAQDIIFSNLVQQIAHRHGVTGTEININMEEVMQNGVEHAKLITNVG